MQGTSIVKNSVKILLCIFLLLVLVQGVFAADAYQFVTKWGTEGTGDGQFNYISGIAVDSSGNVYVADRYKGIQKFSSTGTFLGKWGTPGWNDGQLNDPWQVAVDSSGNVYVADGGNSRIQKFSSTGTFLGKWGTNGTGDGQFYHPTGVAVDSSGNVYVYDFFNNRIQKFSSTGIFLAKWAVPVTSNDPRNHYQGIGVDSSGNVYVPDFYNSWIQKFSPTGTFLAKWGPVVPGAGQFNYPQDVAVDSSDNVYYADMNQLVQKFSSNGVFLGKSGGEYGWGDGQFIYPHSLAVDHSGNVYVGDQTDRIQKFAPVSSQTVDLTGSWDMGGPDGVWGFGKCMALSQSGSQVTGNYIHEQGRVTGTVTGNTFSGTWSEAPTYTGETDSGKFIVTISSNGNSFSGTTGYGNSLTGYSWSGTKSSAVCPVTTVPLSVTAISPSTGTNDHSITATVTGTGFKPGAVAKLTLPGQPDIVASSVTLTGNTLITCTFDLSGKSTGIWNLAVTNPGDGTTSVRSNAFTLTALHTYGWIIVSSNPSGADIFIDGVQQKETTPYTFPNIAPGTHSVTVSKIGYLGQYKTITVSAGQPVNVDVTIEPLKPDTGIISVRSTPPGAGIMLDGKYSGQATPYDFSGISPGVHTVEMTLVGYNSYTETVTVVPGTTVVVKKVWLPIPVGAVVFVNSNPDGANVYIDDSYKGVTPTSLHLEKGTYILKLTKKDYVDDESPLYVSSSGPITVTRTLNLPDPGFEGILAVISLVAVILFARRFR